MIAFVRGVIFASACAGSKSNVSGSTSAKIGVPPWKTTAFAEAAKVIAGTITSSPGPMPAANIAPWRAAAPVVTLPHTGAPGRLGTALSDGGTVGPLLGQVA